MFYLTKHSTHFENENKSGIKVVNNKTLKKREKREGCVDQTDETNIKQGDGRSENARKKGKTSCQK